MAANAGPSQVLSPAALTEAAMQVLPETDAANTTLDQFCKRRTRLETHTSRRASTLRILPRVDARRAGGAASPRRAGWLVISGCPRLAWIALPRTFPG
eukprot:39739-Pyramimonas_sp.AAC.1